MPVINQTYEDLFVKYHQGTILPDDEYQWVVRFLDKFREGKPKACWNFTGFCDRNGCGIFAINHKHGILHKRAHRLAWCIYKGAIPADMEVIHECNNHSCLNPNHLMLGTQADCMEHRRKSNGYRTQPKGAAHPLASMNDKQVIRIRELYLSGKLDQYQLAAKFKVDQSYISYLVNFQTYTPTNQDGTKDLTAKTSNIGRDVYKLRKQKQAEKLYLDYLAGLTYVELVAKYKISMGSVYMWIKRAGGPNRNKSKNRETQ